MKNIERKHVLALLARSFTEPVRMADMAEELSVKKSQMAKLRGLVASLVKEGRIVRVGRGAYTLASENKGDSAGGRIRVHPAGYGFVEREDGEGDVFVPAKYRGASLDGDRVLLSTWPGHKGTEGRVTEVLERGRAKLTGVLTRAGRAVHLEPDDPRIATDFGRVSLEGGTGQGKEGECVVVEITRYPTDAVPELRGRVIRVLGQPEDPHTEIEKILACGDIPCEFPRAALQQAKDTATEVGTEDLSDRIDLRDRDFLTIDPETARDFDDALCVEPGPHGGPRVWVAVADVSHYVRPGDPLDQEAQVRGVSVYLPDRVIPMLPLELSSGICSLNPDVDRCAMVVCLDFDRESSKIVRTGFSAAVIRSRARLDYPGVAGALTGDFRGRRERYRQWKKSLTQLNRIAQRLRVQRMKRGALELHVPEAKVVLDADNPRLVRDVVQSKGDPQVKGAYSLVEEFMIAANEAVGAFFEEREVDVVWRVHGAPDEERLVELARVSQAYGVKTKNKDLASPAGMREILAAFEDHPAGRSLSFLALRSLKQAVYDTTNIGHFGLASEEYLHFTSPIRRYSDVLVHRALKAQLRREGQASAGGPGGRPMTRSDMDELASLVSSHERRAAEVEREAVSMYRAYLMRDHVGEEFAGRVSAVTHFGVFVEIEEPFVEGLIKYQDLGDDYYEYDAEKLRVYGKRTGFSLGLGDRVDIQVVQSSITRRQIDFRLLGADISEYATAHAEAPARRGRKPNGRPKSPRRGGPKKSRKGAPKKSRKTAPKKGTVKGTRSRRRRT